MSCAVSLLLGAVFLLIAAATGIAEAMNWPLWAGFLVVALLLAGGAMATFAMGRKQISNLKAVPPETVSTLKENAEWIAKRLSSERK